MTLKSKAIEIALTGVARWIASPEAWEQVRGLVSEAVRLDIDSDAKRQVVIEQAKQLGWRWADWALNLLIEIAVALVERKLTKSVA